MYWLVWYRSVKRSISSLVIRYIGQIRGVSNYYSAHLMLIQQILKDGHLQVSGRN